MTCPRCGCIDTIVYGDVDCREEWKEEKLYCEHCKCSFIRRTEYSQNGMCESDTLYEILKDGKDIIKRVSDVSSVIAALKGFLNIIRIYTSDENREKVNKAANLVFGEESI